MLNNKKHQTVLPAALSFYSLFVFSFSANIVIAIINRGAAEFKISEGDFARIFSMQFLGFFGATVIGGVLADIIGKKKIFISSCILMIAGGLICFNASGLTCLFTGALLMGMGGGIMESMGVALLCDVFPERKKFYLNFQQVFYCLGAIVAPVLAGWLLPRGVSWWLSFTVITGMAVVVLIMAGLTSFSTHAAKEDVFSWAELKKVLMRFRFISPCIMIVIYVFAESALLVFAPTYLLKRFDAPENWSLYTNGLFWGTMTVGRLACSYIPERISYRWILIVLTLGSILCMGMQAFAWSWGVSILLFIASGLFFSGIWAMIIGFTSELNPGLSGSVIGITIAAGSLGCVASPVIGGYLISRVDLTWFFPILTIPFMLSLGLLCVLKPVARYL